MTGMVVIIQDFVYLLGLLLIPFILNFASKSTMSINDAATFPLVSGNVCASF